MRSPGSVAVGDHFLHRQHDVHEAFGGKACAAHQCAVHLVARDDLCCIVGIDRSAVDDADRSAVILAEGLDQEFADPSLADFLIWAETPDLALEALAAEN